MAQEKRRAEIVKILKEATGPITGGELSTEFAVTRQIIVGDIAVLRARGEQIIATPQGYLLYKPPVHSAHRATVAVRHGNDYETIAAELNLIVDLGGKIVDVTVEHPLYGELTANLQIATREDVAQFVAKMGELKAEPLLVLTDGYHLHTIEAPASGKMEEIREALRSADYLAE